MLPSWPIRLSRMPLSVHTAVMENGACSETVNNDLFKVAAMRFSVRLLKRSSAPVQYPMFRKAGGIALQQLLIERRFQFGVSCAEYQRRGSLFPQFFPYPPLKSQEENSRFSKFIDNYVHTLYIDERL